MNSKKVYIILVNYNGWADTIECIESILKNNYLNYQIIVVDNNSPNNSLEYIKMWAEGKLTPYIPKDNTLRNLSFPYSNKPIPYVLYNKEEALNGGIIEREQKIEKFIEKNKTITNKYPLIFIQAFENKGFAAGNNIGIKYALYKNDFDYIWLLNNDTVIDKNALLNLIKKYENDIENKKIGLIGSKLLYYNNPNLIQVIAGTFNNFFAISKNIGALEIDNGQYNIDNISFDYISGASMFAPKTFLQDVGLICEDYFLYFEEIDWAKRAKNKNWKIKYCYNSKIYHKDGTSIGTGIDPAQRSDFIDYLYLKNKILFTKKHNPKNIFILYLSFIIFLFYRLKRKKYKVFFKTIIMLFKSMFTNKF